MRPANQRGARDAAQPPYKFQVLRRREIRIEARFFGYVADDRLIVLQLLLDVDASPTDHAASGSKQSDDHAHRRALTRPVAAKKPDNVSRLRAETQRPHCWNAAIAFPDLVDLEHVRLQS